MRNPFLVGATVYLRPLDPDDAPRATEWMNDREVIDALAAYRRMTLEAELQFIRESVSRDTVALGIALRDGDLLIGVAALSEIDHRQQIATFGIVIGAKECRGRGIGTAVAGLLRDYGFTDLNLHRIELEVLADHPAAITAYERAGFAREGVRREARLRGGARVDSIVMAILRPEWEASRSA